MKVAAIMFKLFMALGVGNHDEDFVDAKIACFDYIYGQLESNAMLDEYL